MPVAVAEEKQQLRRMIDRMEPEDVLRMLDYAAYLRYLEEREDAEDIGLRRGAQGRADRASERGSEGLR
ncbi:MAG: hypothetical protein PHV21_06515, partial [Synergistaceae bacterium]|nr:hypothetical protein [Synergistaceae bacterium]